jgi:hypothetical protein
MRVSIKVAVVNRKHPQYTSELAELAVRHNLDFITIQGREVYHTCFRKIGGEYLLERTNEMIGKYC